MFFLFLIVVLTLSSTESAAIDFFEGFLEGASEQVMGKCVSDFTDAYNSAISAFDDFKNAFNQGSTSEAWSGMSSLARTFEDVKDAISACQGLETFVEDISKVAEEIASQQYVDIILHEAWNIVFHGREIYSDIKNAVDAFESGNSFRFGESLGKLAVILIEGAANDVDGVKKTVTPKKMSAPSNDIAIDFFQGFLQGAGEQIIGQCVADFTDAFNAASNAFNEFSSAFSQRSTSEARNGFSSLAQCIYDIHDAISACQGIETFVEDLGKLADEIAAQQYLDIAIHEVWNILWHGSEIYGDLKSAVDAFESGSAYNFGDSLGKLTVVMIEGAVSTPSPSPSYFDTPVRVGNSAAREFLKGFVIGIEKQVMGGCISDFENAYSNAIRSISEFKRAFEHKNKRDAKEGFKELGTCFYDVYAAVKACKGAVTFIKDIEKIAAEVSSQQYIEIGISEIWTFLFHGREIVDDIKKAVHAYESGNVEIFGEEMGRLLIILIEGAAAVEDDVIAPVEKSATAQSSSSKSISSIWIGVYTIPLALVSLMALVAFFMFAVMITLCFCKYSERLRYSKIEV